jgi:hypothetical protein
VTLSLYIVDNLIFVSAKEYPAATDRFPINEKFEFSKDCAKRNRGTFLANKMEEQTWPESTVFTCFQLMLAMNIGKFLNIFDVFQI